jgi:hypothetical protein
MCQTPPHTMYLCVRHPHHTPCTYMSDTHITHHVPVCQTPTPCTCVSDTTTSHAMYLCVRHHHTPFTCVSDTTTPHHTPFTCVSDTTHHVPVCQTPPHHTPCTYVSDTTTPIITDSRIALDSIKNVNNHSYFNRGDQEEVIKLREIQLDSIICMGQGPRRDPQK